MNIIKDTHIKKFTEYLINEEKLEATIEKYTRDIALFKAYMNKKAVDKKAVLDYKKYLVDKYLPASVNSILSSLNNFFTYMGWHDCKVKALKIQRKVYASEAKELTKNEYNRLLAAAMSKNNERLYLIMQTICSAGIRVSELRYITAEAVGNGYAQIDCKGKVRQILLPKALCKILSKYLKKQKISSGPVFISRSGKPLDRSNIWSDMKKLCESAGVSREKVFPHNLRHLFARTYYSLHKDIVRLADILGHSSVNTTRIYTVESGTVHKMQIERLGLLKC